MHSIVSAFVARTQNVWEETFCSIKQVCMHVITTSFRILTGGTVLCLRYLRIIPVKLKVGQWLVMLVVGEGLSEPDILVADAWGWNVWRQLPFFMNWLLWK